MNARNRRHAGFTLVEMLVVVAIIGILASMVGGVAYMVLSKAKDTQIKVEVDQLDMAMKAFKQQYGVYPPCDLRITSGGTPFPNQNALMGFLMSAFPRYIYNGNAGNIATDLQNAGIDTNHFRPDAALVFWLQGFNPDSTQPFSGVPTSNMHGVTTSTTVTPSFTATTTGVTPFFSFVQTRVVSATVNGVPQFVYVPSNQTVPYVYFDANTFPSTATLLPTSTSVAVAPALGSSPQTIGSPPQFNAQTSTVPNVAGTDAGIAAPYMLDVNNNGIYDPPTPSGSPTLVHDTYANPTSFQIISAGQDGQFGFGPGTTTRSQIALFPAGSGYDSSGNEVDNVTNFNAKTTLGDALP